MVDREMLTAMSEMMDQKLDQKFDEKLKPVYDRLDRLDEQLESNVIPRLDKVESDMRYVRVALLENKIIPQLNTVHSLYLNTSNKYHERTDQIDKMSEDVAVLKSVVSNHSTRLNKIPV